MQKYITTAVFSILLFTTIILTAINYHNNDVLESRINTINKYNEKTVKKDLDSEKGFKEDYYILQQAHDTNLILVVFGLMVAVTGFFTYQNLEAKFNAKTLEMTDQVDKVKSEWKEIREELSTLTVNVMGDGAELAIELAEIHISKNIDKHISYLIKACVGFANLYAFSEKRMEIEKHTDKTIIEIINKNNEGIINSTIDLLKWVNEKLTKNDNIKLSRKDIIEHNITIIRSLKNREVDILLSEIQSKINQNHNLT